MLADNPKKWSVLSGLFLVYMASNGITLHTLPILYPELMEEFGWRESEVTLPATVFFIVGAKCHLATLLVNCLLNSSGNGD